MEAREEAELELACTDGRPRALIEPERTRGLVGPKSGMDGRVGVFVDEDMIVWAEVDR